MIIDGEDVCHCCTTIDGVTCTGAGNGGEGLGLQAVRVAAIDDVNLANELEAGDTIDGVTLVAGDLVLLPDQTSPDENGIYAAVASGAASRASGWNTSDDYLYGRRVAVRQGSYYGASLWELRTQAPTLETDRIDFLRVDRMGDTPTQRINIVSDFCTTAAVWSLGGAGGGSCTTVSTHATGGLHQGEILLEVNDPGSFAFARQRPPHGSWFITDDGPALFQAIIYLEDLPTASEDFEFRVGVIDSDSGPPTDGWYFQLEQSGGAAQWACMTSLGSVRSRFTASATPIANTWVHLEARQNQGASQIDYWIDRVYQGNLTTNIPTTGLSQNKHQMTKILGSGTVQIYSDGYQFLKDGRPIK